MLTSPDTSDATRKAIEKALKRWQGQQEAVDDAVRYVLGRGGTEALPVTSRQRLRASLQQGGGGAQEVAEAVRFVLANDSESLPPHVASSLRDGLAASDGRNFPLQQAVRNELKKSMPDVTRIVLEAGLATADGLKQSVALNIAKVDVSMAPPDFQSQLRHALQGSGGTTTPVQTSGAACPVRSACKPV